MRITLAIALVLLAAQAPAASPTGTILVPAGASLAFEAGRAPSGVTETADACGSVAPLQGLDAWWIHLSPSAAGRFARLSDGVAFNDVDAHFYTASCTLIPYFGMAQQLGVGIDVDEQGSVPANAAWVVVVLVAGADAPFTFTLT